jgi:hypothetical protein
MKNLGLLIATLLISNSLIAGECTLSITRTACPGKEAEMLKPYDGKNPTEEKDAKATTEEACSKAAEKAAKIVRKGVLAKKAVMAKFDGKDLGEKAETKECK